MFNHPASFAECLSKHGSSATTLTRKAQPAPDRPIEEVFMQLIRKLAVLAVLACAGLAVTAGPVVAQQTVKIGSFLSVTGAAAFLGDPELKTLEIYIDRINKEGGLLGRKLQLVHYDDGSEANKANGFAKRLIDNDQVDVILGGTTTGGTMAALPVIDKAGTPFISMAAGVPIIEPTKKWVFKVAPTDRMAAERVFADMKKRNLNKVALISETGGFGQSGRKETLAVAPKYGIEIVADETFGPKDTDVTAQLTKVKANPKVQALFVFGAGQGPAVVTKNIAQLGIKLPVYQSHGVASEEYIKLSGAAAEGVRFPAAALLVADKLPANDPQKKVVTDYKKVFAEQAKADVSTFGGHAYDALMIYVAAVKRANSVDKEKVRAELEKTKGYVGTAGVFNLSDKDHMGLDPSAFRMLEIRKGDWTLVD
jgi:branched-chain amino acid transport system substrate-binding protein